LPSAASTSGTDCNQGQTASEGLAQQTRGRCAERETDPRLPAAACDGKGHDPLDPEHGEQAGGQAESGQKHHPEAGPVDRSAGKSRQHLADQTAASWTNGRAPKTGARPPAVDTAAVSCR